MEDANEPRVLEHSEKSKPPLRLRWTDAAIFGVIIIAAIAFSFYAIHRTQEKHEISDAKQLSTQVINALAKQNTTKLHSLGDKEFQATYTTTKLDDLLSFKTTPPITFAAMYGNTKPVIDLHLVVNNARGQHVVFVYRYDKLKVPFYVRIDTIKTPRDNQWRLEGMSASPDESSLTNPLPAGASSV